MSVLADHPFVKMNGLGNEIVVVDLRRKPAAIGVADAPGPLGRIEFRNVVFRYPDAAADARPTLEGVSFTAATSIVTVATFDRATPLVS